MHTRDLREMSSDALRGRLQQLDMDLAIERRKIAATGTASKKVKVRELRRTRAKILTLLNERETGKRGANA
jgi:large subunit ribosomal protein L29